VPGAVKNYKYTHRNKSQKYFFGLLIIMGLPEAIEFGELAKGQVIANHLEALDHCPVTRVSIQSKIKIKGWQHRFFVSYDGERFSFNQTY
jgi:hypothetical protein